jgi:transposase-like protein
MRGRHALGPELFDRAPGSDLARTRARLVHEAMAGIRRVKDICRELGICSQRFEAIRWDVVVASVAATELGHAGRPRKDVSAADARIAELERENAELRAELQVTRVGAELAATLPRLAGKKP